MFAAVPFSRAKRWEQPQSPPTDEQINTPWRNAQDRVTKKKKKRQSYSALRENEDLMHAAIRLKLVNIKGKRAGKMQILSESTYRKY